jgi:hypothetical protein
MRAHTHTYFLPCTRASMHRWTHGLEPCGLQALRGHQEGRGSAFDLTGNNRRTGLLQIAHRVKLRSGATGRVICPSQPLCQGGNPEISDPTVDVLTNEARITQHGGETSLAPLSLTLGLGGLRTSQTRVAGLVSG